MFPKLLLLSTFYFLNSIVFVSAQFTFTSTGCVDPSGFDSCWASATSEAASLIAKYCNGGACTDENNCYTPDPNCPGATTCVAYTAWLNCALTSCWNRVYSCEYQNLAINAMQNCPLADVFPPYVPAPHEAPGYCSCNMGFVYYRYRQVKDIVFPHCRNNILALQGESGPDSCYPYCYKDETICNCCADSTAVSTFFNSCPNTDPGQLPFFDSLGYFGLQTSNCLTNLTSSVNCSADPYDFTLTPGPDNQTDTLYIGDDLPANGTQPITDNAGDLTTPLSGATLTWSLFSGTSAVATAVPYNAAAVTSGGAAGTAAGTGSAPAATKKSGVGKVGGELWRVLALTVIFGIVLAA